MPDSQFGVKPEGGGAADTRRLVRESVGDDVRCL
jgi:hypothetical protein